MPIARMQTADGRVARVEFPEGTTQEEALRIFAEMTGGQGQGAPAQTAQNGSGEGVFSRPILSQVADAGRAAAHHVMNLPHGIVQGIENVVNYGAQQLPDNPVSRYIDKTVKSDNAALAQREAQYQQNVPDSAGAFAGATVGEVLPLAVNAIAAPLRMAGDYVGKKIAEQVPKVVANATGRIASGATQGALYSAALPVTKGDYGQEKLEQIQNGGLFGASVPAAVGIVKGGVGAVRDIAEPLINPTRTATKKLVAATGIDAQQLAAALKNPVQYVAGSKPTTAQVIATPEAVQLEKALRNNPEFTGKMENIGNANNAARLEAVNNVAGLPGELEQAISNRKDVANKLYGEAYKGYDAANVSPLVKGQITQLLKRPAMQTAMNEAQEIASNEGLKLTDDNAIQGLHYAKLSLDDQISRALRTGDNNASRGLLETKNQLVTLIEKLSSKYKDARTTYAEMSKPVNTMQVGRDLQDVLWNRTMNTGGDPQIQFQNYRSQLAKQLNSAEYGIDPAAEKTLHGVQDDLQRQSISSGLRFPGSDTNYNKQAQGWLSKQLYGDDFSGSGLTTKLVGMTLGGGAGAALGHPYMGATIGAATSLGLSKAAASRVNRALADIMASPEKAAEELDKLTPKQRSTMVNFLLQNPLTSQLIEPPQYAP